MGVSAVYYEAVSSRATPTCKFLASMDAATAAAAAADVDRSCDIIDPMCDWSTTVSATDVPRACNAAYITARLQLDCILSI